jgi:hypothetical protein
MQGSQPQALMADLSMSMDLETAGAATDLSTSAPNANGREIEGGRQGRVRLKSSSRPKSYHQIFEDFQYGQQGRQLATSPSSLSALIDSAIEEHSESATSEDDEHVAGEERENSLPIPPSVNLLPNPLPRRKEDTTRRSKRFSLPAVALHTTNVTARTTTMINGSSGSGSGGNSSNNSSGGASGGLGSESVSGAVGRLRRLSLD